jgi:hypothetical protein
MSSPKKKQPSSRSASPKHGHRLPNSARSIRGYTIDTDRDSNLYITDPINILEKIKLFEGELEEYEAKLKEYKKGYECYDTIYRHYQDIKKKFDNYQKLFESYQDMTNPQKMLDLGREDAYKERLKMGSNEAETHTEYPKLKMLKMPEMPIKQSLLIYIMGRCCCNKNKFKSKNKKSKNKKSKNKKVKIKKSKNKNNIGR